MVRSTPVTKGQIFKLVFLDKKRCVSELMWSQDSKNVTFITVRCLEMLQIAVWKHDVINGYGFWAICLPKIDISTWNSAFYMSRYSSTTCTFFSKFEKKIDFAKSYIKICFHFLGSQKLFLKIWDSSLKKLSILRHLVLFVCILLLISILSDFSNICPFSTKNGMTLGHKARHILKNTERRHIDIRRGMSSVASIPATARTLLKKNRGGRIQLPPQAVAG